MTSSWSTSIDGDDNGDAAGRLEAVLLEAADTDTGALAVALGDAALVEVDVEGDTSFAARFVRRADRGLTPFATATAAATASSLSAHLSAIR